MHSFKRHYGIIVRMTLDPGMRLAIYMLKQIGQFDTVGYCS